MRRSSLNALAPGRTAAEDSELLLQDGLRSGRPVMIPGAFEVRAGRSRESAAVASHAPPTPGTPRPMPRRSLFERLWRYIMRPTDTPA
jgi:hypothetical protein